MQTLDGPKTPRMLRMIKFITQPLEYLEDYQQRYGDIFQVGQAPSIVYVGHPDAIQQIFNAPAEQFHTGGGGGILLKLLGEMTTSNQIVIVKNEIPTQLSMAL